MKKSKQMEIKTPQTERISTVLYSELASFNRSLGENIALAMDIRNRILGVSPVDQPPSVKDGDTYVSGMKSQYEMMAEQFKCLNDILCDLNRF